jgi:hypothetical protein
MESKVSIPFKESNLKYLKKCRFEDIALKIMNQTEGYFLIVERCFIFDAEDKSILSHLNFTKKNAFVIFSSSKWYFCMKEFEWITNLFLHYESIHFNVHTKIHIKQDRKITTVFIVLIDKDHSTGIEDHYSNYLKSTTFSRRFDQKEREIQLDSLVCGKYYLYKSISFCKEENEIISDIVEDAFNRYSQIRVVSEKPQQSNSSISNPDLHNTQIYKWNYTLTKKVCEMDAKRMVDYDRPLCQPFNFEYYCPISGHVVGKFVDNHTLPPSSSGTK